MKAYEQLKRKENSLITRYKIMNQFMVFLYKLSLEMKAS